MRYQRRSPGWIRIELRLWIRMRMIQSIEIKIRINIRIRSRSRIRGRGRRRRRKRGESRIGWRWRGCSCNSYRFSWELIISRWRRICGSKIDNMGKWQRRFNWIRVLAVCEGVSDIISPKMDRSVSTCSQLTMIHLVFWRIASYVERKWKKGIGKGRGKMVDTNSRCSFPFQSQHS